MAINRSIGAPMALSVALFFSPALFAISLKPDQIKNNPLHQKGVHENPVEQFTTWFSEAKKEKVRDPEVFVLATASKSGIPSSRTMWLKSFDNKGFVFFSSSQGFKAEEIKASRYASMTFYWADQQRQINVRGRVEFLSAKESENYFKTRARESQIASWASTQGKELQSRDDLHGKFAELQKIHEGKPIPTPPHWQGYRVVPESIEFWQAGPHTLHDRILYSFKNGKWSTKIISP